MRFAFSIGFLLTVLSWQAVAQPPAIVRTPPTESVLKKVFTTDDGLPQNTPTSLVQTKDGYIWIATYGGLARFDGIKFKVFTTSDYPALINNRLTALAESSDGLLWIGSEDGDLMKYQDGAFSLVWKGTASDSVIWDIYIGTDDRVWLGTDKGLKTYDPGTNEIYSFPTRVLDESVNADATIPVRRFAAGRDGTIWLATSVGVIRYTKGSFEKIDGSDTWVVNADFDGDLLYRSQQRRFAFNGHSFSNITETYPGGFPDPSDTKRDLIFVIDSKLFRPVAEGLEVFPLPEKINNRDIRSVLFDREGNLWVGMQFNLIQFRRRMVTTFTLLQNEVSEPTTSITETPDGSVWVASRGRILRFHGTNSEQSEIFDLGIKPIVSLAVEPSTGVLWVGTEQKIFRFQDGRFIEFVGVDLTGGSDFVLFADRSNTLWIGTKSSGLKTYREGITQTYTTHDGLVSNFVTRIFEDSKGQLWIGSRNGFSLLENGLFKNFTTENGLTNNNVRDFFEDRDGTMWIGTYGGGLLRFRDGIFRSISENDGLAENIVSRILTDDADNFWIMGNRGVYSVSRHALNDFVDGKISRIHCSVYGKEDGMIVSEGNGISPPAGWRAKDGKLWFPMIQGGVVIDPNGQKPISPSVYIEEIMLDGKNVPNGSNIRIRNGEQNLEIHYTGVTFSRPEQLQFRYKLEGFDQDWQQVGSRRVAYYPYLPPGNYTFKVLPISDSANEDGSARLGITVEGPFWRTTTFYLMVLVLVVGLITLAYQYRLRKLEMSRRQQQAFSRQLIDAHESERKRIATDLHDGIGHSLLIVNNWAGLAVNKFDRNTIERKDLEDIATMTASALDETRIISANLRPNQLERFGLTSTLKQMMLTINDSSEINIAADIQDIDKLFTLDDELSIYRIVQESLNNVLKHSNAQNAVLTIERTGSLLNITVVDDGVGIDTKEDESRPANRANLGLNNIRERTKLLGGTCHIKSSKDKGTTVVVSIPMDESLA